MMLGGLVFMGSDVARQAYKLFDTESTRYETIQDKMMFWQHRGRHYTNEILIQYPVGQINPHIASFQQLTVEINFTSGSFADEIKNYVLIPLYAQWVDPIIGYGVFAAQNIPSGSFIGVYAGVLRAMRSHTDNTDYAWTYPTSGLRKESLIIDGQHYGNELSLINHAANPNVKAVYYLISGIFYLCYIALFDISQNQELTVHYGPGYWQTRN